MELSPARAGTGGGGTGDALLQASAAVGAEGKKASSKHPAFEQIDRSLGERTASFEGGDQDIREFIAAGEAKLENWMSTESAKDGSALNSFLRVTAIEDVMRCRTDEDRKKTEELEDWAGGRRRLRDNVKAARDRWGTTVHEIMQREWREHLGGGLRIGGRDAGRGEGGEHADKLAERMLAPLYVRGKLAKDPEVQRTEIKADLEMLAMLDANLARQVASKLAIVMMKESESGAASLGVISPHQRKIAAAQLGSELSDLLSLAGIPANLAADIAGIEAPAPGQERQFLGKLDKKLTEAVGENKLAGLKKTGLFGLIAMHVQMMNMLVDTKVGDEMTAKDGFARLEATAGALGQASDLLSAATKIERLASIAKIGGRWIPIVGDLLGVAGASLELDAAVRAGDTAKANWAVAKAGVSLVGVGVALLALSAGGPVGIAAGLVLAGVALGMWAIEHFFINPWSERANLEFLGVLSR